MPLRGWRLSVISLPVLMYLFGSIRKPAGVKILPDTSGSPLFGSSFVLRRTGGAPPHQKAFLQKVSKISPGLTICYSTTKAFQVVSEGNANPNGQLCGSHTEGVYAARGLRIDREPADVLSIRNGNSKEPKTEKTIGSNRKSIKLTINFKSCPSVFTFFNWAQRFPLDIFQATRRGLGRHINRGF